MKTLTVVNSGAVAKQSAPPFKAFKQLEEDLDDILRRYQNICRLWGRFLKYPLGRVGADDFLEEAEKTLRRFRENGSKEVSDAEAANSALNPPAAFDENDKLKKIMVAAKVGELVGSFPQGNIANPEIYVPMMVNELMDGDDLNVVTLEMTVRAVRKKSRFLPAISEVLEASQVVIDEWSNRYEALSEIEYWAETLQGTVDDCKRLRLEDDERRAAEKVKEEERCRAWAIENEQRLAREAERLLPIKVGDRVFDSQWSSAGTVLEVVSAGTGDFLVDMCWIKYDTPLPWSDDDDDTTTICELGHLRKLIAGDKAYECNSPVTK